LFGKINPSGKLAETFPLKLIDTPAHINFPGGAGTVNYGEGIFIGYRYFDAKELPVLFPFGYGLSYTAFEYSNPKVSARSFKDRDGLTVSVDVTNIGDMTGKEVVQVYVHDMESMLVRPPKELKGFAKLDLQPGETQTANIQLDWRAFAYFHPSYGKWITENGEFEILIGASSADIKFHETVILESTVELPCILDHESTLREWLEDPRGKEIFHPIYQKMQSLMGPTFGSEEGKDDSFNTDMMRLLMEMPLLSILHFQENDLDLPAPADKVVDMLLIRAHGETEK
ncbi:MAG: fibronectin type III-like domain-contianing protein, partial [Deltaproteobacteria bacterium]|nr:fibronectin type III-like domain-contianing protein [Deltaproteobacteria bacterium]